MDVVSRERSFREPICHRCGAGKTLGFNWEFARTTTKPDLQRDLTAFVQFKALRYGTLFKCKVCGSAWYLCSRPAFMNAIADERLPLIKAWDEKPIPLTTEHRAALLDIGATPPDLYGNGREFHETPCTVTTRDGMKFDTAMVSLQRHAPFEDWRECRLASDIADISPSPHALPLEVRMGCSRAEEVRMGFSPTLLELPDGSVVAVNGRHSFFIRSGCSASKVRLSPLDFDLREMPPIHHDSEKIVYFVADPHPGTTL